MNNILMAADMMAPTDISFPKLGIYLENVPKTFSIFGFQIAFYGLIIGIGILLGLLAATREAKVTGQDPDVYWDFSIYAILFSILGARIYYVVFSWNSYKDNLLSVFNIRGGGLAIYGGVIAAAITLAVFAKVKKQNAFQMADTCVIGLLIGQIIGRFGNFMNREAFGDYTNGLLAMRLPLEAVRQNEITEKMLAHITEGVNYIQVHPTFLYESLWNLMVLVLILIYKKHKKFQGEICLCYLGGYGIGRLWIEGLRTDQLWIPGTTIAVSQVFAVLLVLFAIGAEIVMRIRLNKKAIS